jgi:hypothetical protein
LARRFEVPYELSGKTVRLVVDPHAQRVVGVEDEAGASLGQATALDVLTNVHRTRRKPEPPQATSETVNPSGKGPRTGPNLVELAHARYHGAGHGATPNASTTNSGTNSSQASNTTTSGI